MYKILPERVKTIPLRFGDNLSISRIFWVNSFIASSTCVTVNEFSSLKYLSIVFASSVTKSKSNSKPPNFNPIIGTRPKILLRFSTDGCF